MKILAIDDSGKRVRLTVADLAALLAKHAADEARAIYTNKCSRRGTTRHPLLRWDGGAGRKLCVDCAKEEGVRTRAKML